MGVFDPTQGLPPDFFGAPLQPGVSAGVGNFAAGQGLNPATQSSAAAAAGLPPGMSTAGAAPPLSFAQVMQQFPNAIWGGTDNVNSHSPPQWLVDLVNSYKQNPSHQRWDHIVNGTGVQAPYSSLTMPDWLKQWLVQAMGPDPSVSSKGGV